LAPGRELSHLESLVPAHGFHDAIRAQERRELALSTEALSIMPPAARAPVARVVPTSGEFVVLNTQSGAGSACSDPIFVGGVVEAVSETAVVVADVSNPPGGFSTQDFEHFAATFDTLVTPVIDEHFGSPSDLDGNGRTIVFFTREVNALGSGELGAITTGFFFSRDLFPVDGAGTPLNSCPSSNEAELLYLLVPDPTGEVGAPISRQAATELAIATMAHEQQHLVNAANRLFGPGGPFPFEETWLNEGLSHIAEELAFYRASGLGPGLDLGSEHLGDQTLGSFNTFQIANYRRLRHFYYEPQGNSPFGKDSRATRGAAWSFLRYAADRAGKGDPDFFRSLVRSSLRGFDNLGAAVGGVGTVLAWLGDWSVAAYADNRVLNLPSRFQNPSWNNASLYGSFGFDPPYILTSELDAHGRYDAAVVEGGSSYIQFGVPTRTVATLEITSGGGNPPPTMWVTVLRTR
jgi:hypothetical protein